MRLRTALLLAALALAGSGLGLAQESPRPIRVDVGLVLVNVTLLDSRQQPVTGYGQEDGFGRVIQGSLESSNVEIVQEMTDMIAAQRAYEINARAIQASDDMAQQTSELLR